MLISVNETIVCAAGQDAEVRLIQIAVKHFSAGVALHGFRDGCVRILRETSLEPHYLELELTVWLKQAELRREVARAGLAIAGIIAQKIQHRTMH